MTGFRIPSLCVAGQNGANGNHFPLRVKTMNAHTSLPANRHPPYLPVPLALIIAALLSGSALAADYSMPQRFDTSNTAVTGLDQKQVDVTSASPAITLQGVDFSLQDVSLHNASGPGLDVGASAHLTAENLQAITLGSDAPALHVYDQGRAELTGASSLQTQGARSPAAAVENGELYISDASLKTLDVLSPGIQVGSNAALQVERSQIETIEMTSAGIRESDNALPGVVRDSQIHTHKAESAGVQLSASSGLSLENTQVLTDASSSPGVFALSGSQVALSRGSNVHTRGYVAPALHAMAASNIEMTDGQLFTEGRRAAAARAGGSSHINLLRTHALAAGPEAAALHIQGDSRISASDSQIGNVDGSTVLFSAEQSTAGPGQLDLTGSTLSGPSALIEAQAGSQGVVNGADSQLLAPSGNAFLVAPGSTLTADLTASRVESAELANVNGDGHFSLTASDSNLSGDTHLQAPGSGQLDLDLRNTNWLLHGDSTLSNLALDRATVFFGGNGYQTLTIHGDLTGNGRFQMKTDLASTQGDLLQVQGQVSGQHELVVADSGHDAQGAPLKVVGSGGGAGQFTLYGGHVDAGAFRYALQQQGNDWYLAEAGQLAPMQQLTPALQPQKVPTPNGSSIPMTALNPSLPPQKVPTPNGSSIPMTALNPSLPPQKVPTPNGSSIPMTALNPSIQPQAQPTRMAVMPSQSQRLSKGANAALGMQTAAANLWQSELGTLTRRMGELRLGHDQGGLWSRAVAGTLDVDSGYSRSFEQDTSGAEVGADRALEQRDATLYVGGMLGAGQSDQDFGEHSSGDIDSRTMGLYATYMRDDGWYLDTVLKYDHLKGDVKVASNVGERVRGHYDADAYGASAELGRQIALGNGWFVEPQLQLSAAHLQGPQYTSTDGLEVDADATDSVQARVGGRVGRALALDSGAQVEGYLSASLIDELAGESTVTVDGHELDNQLPGSRADLGAGAALQVSQRQKLMIEAHYADGHEIQQPLALTLGYRFLW